MTDNPDSKRLFIAPNECSNPNTMRKLPDIITNIYNEIDYIENINNTFKLTVVHDDGSVEVKNVGTIVVRHMTLEDLTANSARITPSQPMMVVKTPGGGIAATTSNTSMSSATCTEWYQDNTNALTESTNTITVYNIDDTAVPGDAWGMAWYNFTDKLWYTNSCCWNTTMTTIGSVTDPGDPPPTPADECTTGCNANTTPFQIDLTLAGVGQKFTDETTTGMSQCAISSMENCTIDTTWCDDLYNNTFRLTSDRTQHADNIRGLVGRWISGMDTLNWHSSVRQNPVCTGCAYYMRDFGAGGGNGILDNPYPCDATEFRLVIGSMGNTALSQTNADGTYNWRTGVMWFTRTITYANSAFRPGQCWYNGLTTIDGMWGFYETTIPFDCSSTVSNQNLYSELPTNITLRSLGVTYENTTCYARNDASGLASSATWQYAPVT